MNFKWCDPHKLFFIPDTKNLKVFALTHMSMPRKRPFP